MGHQTRDTNTKYFTTSHKKVTGMDAHLLDHLIGSAKAKKIISVFHSSFCVGCTKAVLAKAFLGTKFNEILTSTLAKKRGCRLN